MLLCKVAAFSLLCSLTAVYGDGYNIPQPKIEVFRPRGFRISIEDSAGVNFVAFHVNINEHLHQYDAGEFSMELFRPVNGRWVFELPDVSVKLGDQVYYWLFLIRGRVGYRKEDTSEIFKIEDGSFESVYPPSGQSPPYQGHTGSCRTCTGEEESLPTSTIPTISISAPETSSGSNLNVCEHFLLNTTQSLINLQSEIAAVRNLNRRLSILLEKYPDAKKLTLTGKITFSDDPARTVLFTIRETLQLNPDIVSAVKKSDNRIDFQVATVIDKLEILEAAKEKLTKSKISIF